MRKHFLILMMTLLSVTAFAETDISSDPKVSMSTGNVTYGGGVAPVIQVLYDGYKLTIDDGNDLNGPEDYTWDGKYYTTSACNKDAGAINKLKVGTYWVKIVGEGVYTGTRVQSFEVTQADLTVTVSFNKAPTKVYDGTTANPEDVTVASWTAEGEYKNGEHDNTGGVTGTVTWSYKNANVGNQVITFAGLSAPNYKIKYAAATIAITPKALTAAMVTKANFEETYKGKAFNPNKEIAVVAKDAEVSANNMKAGTDFDVKVYSDESMTAEVANPRNAGTYYVGAKGAIDKNYNGGPIAVGTFTIKKANLTVLAKDQDFNYDATNSVADKFQTGIDYYEVIGLVGDDKKTDISGTALDIYPAADAAKKVAGEYTIKVSGSTNDNYNIFFQNGTFTINKLNLTITATNQAIALGAALPNPLPYTITGALNKTEQNDMESDAKDMGNVKVTRNKDDNDDLGKHPGVLVVSYNDKADVFKNYNVTAVDGDLTISGGAIVVTVKPQTIAYGDAETWSTPKEGRDYYLNGVAEADKAKLNIVMTREDAENKEPKTYKLTITGTKPEGYDAINFVNSTLTIDKRELQVTALDQTLSIGMTKDNLDITKVEFAEGHGLAFEDKVEDILQMDFSGATLVGGKLSKKETVAGGIVLALIKGGADPHYTIAATAGKLTVIDAMVLNRPNSAAYTADPISDDAASVIANADGSTTDVTFGTFEMKAEKWYPIVLPFETTVREISNAFGYAVVNVLKKDNTDPTKILFKLWMGAIPANEPFVVKIDKDKNMNTVLFPAKTIVNSAAPEVEDASGVKFIGSYEHKVGFAANEAFFSVSAAKNDYYWGSASNKTYMAPLGAYFQIPEGSSARTIVFEEPDGSTTAIEAVTTVNAAKNVEGWYTVNGMKLETAPTQKGIYIKDGKKVVLK